MFFRAGGEGEGEKEKEKEKEKGGGWKRRKEEGRREEEKEGRRKRRKEGGEGTVDSLAEKKGKAGFKKMAPTIGFSAAHGVAHCHFSLEHLRCFRLSCLSRARSMWSVEKRRERECVCVCVRVCM